MKGAHIFAGADDNADANDDADFDDAINNEWLTQANMPMHAHFDST